MVGDHVIEIVSSELLINNEIITIILYKNYYGLFNWFP
jgi:hypothetical protein